MASVHLVLLHGELMDSASWGNPFVRALEPFQVTSLDLDGHGARERRAIAAELDDVVDGLRERFLQAASPGPDDVVVLVGHSLGAWIAMRWAQRHAGVDAVCAIGSIAGLDLVETYAGLARAIEERAGLAPETAQRLVGEQWMRGVPEATRKRFVRRLKTRRPTPMLDTLRMLLCADPVAPEDVPVPLCAIRGVADPLAPRRHDDVLVGQSHFPHLEDPAAVAAQVHVMVHHAVVRRAVVRTWLHGDPTWIDGFRSPGWIRADPWHGTRDLSSYGAIRTDLPPVDAVELLDATGDGETFQCRVRLTRGDRTWILYLLQTWVRGTIHFTAASYPRDLLDGR
jgi:pimeloyl-ACP methyl ester carboxylesterase